MFEDDVQLMGGEAAGGRMAPGGPAAFLPALRRVMAALPEDWDLLWLNHGASLRREPGGLLGEVGPGVQLLTANYQSVAVAYTRRLALKVRCGVGEWCGGVLRGALPVGGWGWGWRGGGVVFRGRCRWVGGFVG